MFFGVAPRFCKKRCFQNRRNFAETAENVVPNWRGRQTQFLHPRVRNRLSWSRQRNPLVPIYLSLHSPSFPIHLQEDKDNYLIFLAVSLLDNRSLSIILMIELFLCNKYLSFFLSWFWSIFLCFCWLCLFFLVGASASDSPSSFLFLSSFFCSSCCLSSFLGCMSSCSCVCVCVCVFVFCFSSSCFVSFSCVSFSS